MGFWGRLFDLEAQPSLIDPHLARDRRLARSVRARPGLRVPGAWDGFEVAVRAVLGQQVTVAGARTLARRLVERFGAPIAAPGEGAGEPGAVAPQVRSGLTVCFPSPRALVDADVACIGLPRARADAIRGLARAVEADPRALDSIESLDGIGPWTAATVAMRTGRDPDALPASDRVLRRMLSSVDGPLCSAREVEAASSPWRPWRAYAVLHLWTMAAAGDGNAVVRIEGFTMAFMATLLKRGNRTPLEEEPRLRIALVSTDDVPIPTIPSTIMPFEGAVSVE